MLREYATNYIFVDIDTESVSNLLGDAHTAKSWIAPGFVKLPSFLGKRSLQHELTLVPRHSVYAEIAAELCARVFPDHDANRSVIKVR